MTTGRHEQDVAKVRSDRERTYGSPLEAQTNCGLAWTGILQDHYQITLPHPIPPHVVNAMFVAHKLGRSVRPFPRKDADDYIDAHNYLDFAEESNPNIPRKRPANTENAGDELEYVSVCCARCGASLPDTPVTVKTNAPLCEICTLSWNAFPHK